MTAAKVMYGSAFALVLPVLLAAWARLLSDQLPGLPAFQWPLIGAALAFAGVGLIAVAMRGLWVHGGGLPMNAFPPPRLVIRGVYRLLPHPIYVGFVIACAGVSLVTGSAPGLWVITPLAALGCMAIVYGYERHDLDRRFGADRPKPLLRLPPASEAPPTFWDRLSIGVLVLLPWLIAYEALGHATPSRGISAFLPFEHSWPVVEWTEWVYISAYPAVVLIPLAAHRSSDLRRFAIAGIVGSVIGHLAFFVVPLLAEPRAFEPATLAGRILMLERADGIGGRAAFPSFHVFWAVLTAWLFARSFPRWRAPAWIWAAAVAASCLTTGMHALCDVAAGVALAAASLHSAAIWHAAERSAERIANSWREWRLGPMRIINYGGYAGLGAFLGTAGAGLLAGPDESAAIAAISLFALVGAGLWGQALVGSRTLLRPFGYYGSVLGATCGLVAVGFLGGDLWQIAAALATVAPWVQAAGRLRCLVQGCCHGAPAHDGIRYRHPLSRVCRIAHLEGVPIYPTPLYSISGNIVIGLVLARLWSLQVPASFLAGIYLVLAGLARFVEESFRGEPQTPIRAGLRLYQWFAAASIGLGALLTVIPTPTVRGSFAADWRPLALGVIVGAMYWFAMGVDFPASNRRFSRLA